MTREPIIEARGISKRYRGDGKERIVFSDFDFHVERGEFVSVVGPSGCGKTTLLRLLSGLETSDAGRVVKRSKYVGVSHLFQDPCLLPWLDVAGNIALPYRVRRNTHTADIRNLIRLVGLRGSERLFPQELSGGMRQRVALARSLLERPDILLLDEPFGALDALSRERLGFELLRIRREIGFTAVFVTHSLEEAVLLSDRVIVLPPPVGASVEEVRVGLPRPRKPEMRQSDEFMSILVCLRRHMGMERKY